MFKIIKNSKESLRFPLKCLNFTFKYLLQFVFQKNIYNYLYFAINFYSFKKISIKIFSIYLFTTDTS